MDLVLNKYDLPRNEKNPENVPFDVLKVIGNFKGILDLIYFDSIYLETEYGIRYYWKNRHSGMSGWVTKEEYSKWAPK